MGELHGDRGFALTTEGKIKELWREENTYAKVLLVMCTDKNTAAKKKGGSGGRGGGYLWSSHDIEAVECIVKHEYSKALRPDSCASCTSFLLSKSVTDWV